MSARGRRLALFVGGLVVAASAGAQISPGPLASPHAALEGSGNCLTCHRAGQGVDAALCFACHKALAERVASGRGLHADGEHRACERCHSEHNGREFALVYWPDGEAAFEHARGGWPLAGRHARLACRDCHRAERVAPRLRELEPELDPGRTFLGLPTACVDCHADPHRGSMRGESCADCHSQESWKEPKRFDHATTRFPLEGAHGRTACADCHRQPEVAADEPRPRVFDQFRAASALPACADCHRDPHAGRLGRDCASCHSTSTFRAAKRAGFDHDRTAYPLRGRHLAVACEKCHAPGAGLRVAGFERCAACHRDPHLGQLAAAAVGGGCDACHSLDAFQPARYGFDEHQRSRFPLAGAHRAVPCSACHAEAAASEISGAPRVAARARRFRFASSECADCHRDPHGGELERWTEGAGCRACHGEESWRPARFDHPRTRFPLTGAHARAACEGCHPRGEVAGERRFAGRPLDCAGCHRDVHAGQFEIGGATDCARCHGLETFRPAPGFDHARTRFPLDGRHLGVACARCHPTETTPEGALVRYRPRPVECAGCHATAGGAGGAGSGGSGS
jgi:hypothetical protein